MNQKKRNLSSLQSNLLLLEKRKFNSQQGERFLEFSLKAENNALIALKDLRGTIEISLREILPIPHVAEFWLGIINWQGEAVWILDLAQLLGAPNWYQKKPLITFGMIMLIEMEKQIIGLLVEKIQGIESYIPENCLPITDINFVSQKYSASSTTEVTLRVCQTKSLFKGYFLNNYNEPSMVLDINSLFLILQG